MDRYGHFWGSVPHKQFFTVISFCNFFFFQRWNHLLHSCNSDWQSAPFHPTPLLWSVMGIAAWLPAGTSCSWAGVAVRLLSSSCPSLSCQCATTRRWHKLRRNSIAIFLLEDMKYSLSWVTTVVQYKWQSTGMFWLFKCCFAVQSYPSSIYLLLVSFV